MLAIIVLSKYCSMCTSFKAKGTAVLDHNCVKNHEGSSKSMESKACVSLLIHMHEEGFTVTRLVGDDDSTFRSNTRHSLKGKFFDEDKYSSINVITYFFIIAKKKDKDRFSDFVYPWSEKLNRKNSTMVSFH